MHSAFVILVLIDIVDSTKFLEKVGDMKAAQAMRVYDRIFRGLLIKYNGLEIDKTDGALLLFETMREALQYTTEYHNLVEQHLGLKSRCGIHCGVVVMHSNNNHFVARGAKPIEVEGIQKAIAARIMSLAGGGQTFMSKRAGEYAAPLRGKLLMRDIGVWQLKGVKLPMQLYALGDSTARMTRPRDKDKVKMVRPPRYTPRERRMRFLRAYIYRPLIVVSLYWLIVFLAVLEFFGKTGTGMFFRTLYKIESTAWAYLTLPFYRDFWSYLFFHFS